MAADYEALIRGYEKILADLGVFGAIDYHLAVPLCLENVAWSPDGESLVFVFPCLVGYPAGLFTVEANGGVPELIFAPVTSVLDLGWSPDGSEIVFATESLETGARELLLFSVDDSQRAVLAENAMSPEWSPDGSKLAYATASPNGVVISLREDGETLTIVELMGDVEPQIEIRWSPDGNYLAYTLDRSLFVVEANPGSTTSLAHPGPVITFDWGQGT